MSKRALLLGGTGAIGIYLAPALVERGYDVTITTREERQSDDPLLRYIKCNARNDVEAVGKILAEGWDIVVDFMIYHTDEFRARCVDMLTNAEHYIFLSSYRVYAESKLDATREDSPRLLDMSEDEEYLATDEYALAKARQEDIIRGSGHANWTIVRPTITYSTTRFQLVTLEAGVFVNRARRKSPVIVPEPALSRITTMTWAGDVAQMIAALANESMAITETFNVCTSEHHTWEEIAGYYRDILGLEIVPVSIEDYLRVTGLRSQYQLRYDRLLDRVMDNAKILRATNMEQSSLMPLRNGLERELSRLLSSGCKLVDSPQINDTMEILLTSNRHAFIR